jgi:hypothetical protein
MYFDINIGDKLSNHAAPLVVHPLSQQPGDTSLDFNCYKAVAMSASDFKFSPDKQAGLAVEFMLLPDTSVIPPRFLLFGNPTVGLVGASAAAPVAGGSNVGNGTITSVSVNNTNTKTETISVLVVGKGNPGANAIYVSGSVSGPLGEVSLGAASGSLVSFVANPITMQINQAGTQFAVGDVFTIATSGANYA